MESLVLVWILLLVGFGFAALYLLAKEFPLLMMLLGLGFLLGDNDCEEEKK